MIVGPATDVYNAEGMIATPGGLDIHIHFNSEQLAEHALASAAIPVLFPVVRIGKDYYADGGLSRNTPIRPATWLGADRVLTLLEEAGVDVYETDLGEFVIQVADEAPSQDEASASDWTTT